MSIEKTAVVEVDRLTNEEIESAVRSWLARVAAIFEKIDSLSLNGDEKSRCTAKLLSGWISLPDPWHEISEELIFRDVIDGNGIEKFGWELEKPGSERLLQLVNAIIEIQTRWIRGFAFVLLDDDLYRMSERRMRQLGITPDYEWLRGVMDSMWLVQTTTDGANIRTESANDVATPKVSIEREALKAVIDGGMSGVLNAARKVPRRIQVDSSMKTMFLSDPLTYAAWTGTQWVDHFGCKREYVFNSETWQKTIPNWKAGNAEMYVRKVPKQIKQGAMQELLTGKRRLPGFSGEWDNTELAGNVALKSGHHVLATYCNESGHGKPYLTGPSDFPNGKVLRTKFTTNPTTLCRKDDILVTVKGSGCGTIAVADAEYCISRQLAALTITHGDSRFIYYSLERAAIAFRDSASGLIPGLSRSDILRQRLPMPPTTLEQTAIATVLSDMDTEIESLEAKLAKAREIKQGMMQELLTGRIRLV